MYFHRNWIQNCWVQFLVLSSLTDSQTDSRATEDCYEQQQSTSKTARCCSEQRAKRHHGCEHGGRRCWRLCITRVRKLCFFLGCHRIMVTSSALMKMFRLVFWITQYFIKEDGTFSPLIFKIGGFSVACVCVFSLFPFSFQQLLRQLIKKHIREISPNVSKFCKQ